MSLRQHASSVVVYRPPHPADFVEKYAGYLIATVVGIVGAIFLQLTILQIPIVEIARRELRIRLQPPPALPNEEVQPLEAVFTEVAATSVNPADTEEFRSDADKGGGDPAEVADEPVNLASWLPATEQDRRKLDDILAQVNDSVNAVEQRATEIKAEINRLSVESVGRQFTLNSDGGRRGIIRTIDVEQFPEDLVMRVLARYGITVEFRHVTPDVGQRSFLNAATTAQGTFTSTVREGYYEVFVLSTKAVSMMATMELQALQKRGHDPVKTRIREVTFGIVKDEEYGDYALDVVDLKVERLR